MCEKSAVNQNPESKLIWLNKTWKSQTQHELCWFSKDKRPHGTRRAGWWFLSSPADVRKTLLLRSSASACPPGRRRPQGGWRTEARSPRRSLEAHRHSRSCTDGGVHSSWGEIHTFISDAVFFFQKAFRFSYQFSGSAHVWQLGGERWGGHPTAPPSAVHLTSRCRSVDSVRTCQPLQISVELHAGFSTTVITKKTANYNLDEPDKLERIRELLQVCSQKKHQKWWIIGFIFPISLAIYFFVYFFCCFDTCLSLSGSSCHMRLIYAQFGHVTTATTFTLKQLKRLQIYKNI